MFNSILTTNKDACVNYLCYYVPEIPWDRKRVWKGPKWAQEGYPGPADYNAILFKSILDDKILRKYVKKVVVFLTTAPSSTRSVALFQGG